MLREKRSESREDREEGLWGVGEKAGFWSGIGAHDIVDDTGERERERERWGKYGIDNSDRRSEIGE